VLIDAGPDFRAQALAAGLERLDALLLTHSHFDHIAGIDDLRPLNFRHKQATPVYGDEQTLQSVRERFSYAFGDGSDGSTRPVLELRPFSFYEPFLLGDTPVTPLAVLHGTWRIAGFRIGDLGYVTDASALPPETVALLRGLDVLVLNALRYEPHPTHFSLREAIEVIGELRPRRAFLVHLTHAFDHAAVSDELPADVYLAYDGLVVEICASQ
jgi:phosphoribosyl 1,2-cyclic phosphate phosphodiesterase